MIAISSLDAILQSLVSECVLICLVLCRASIVALAENPSFDGIVSDITVIVFAIASVLGLCFPFFLPCIYPSIIRLLLLEHLST